MKIRRKRKFTKEFKKIITICFLFIIFGVLGFISKETLFNNNSLEENRPSNNINSIDINNYITNSSEINPDKIEEFISKGMSVEDFKSTIIKEEEYVDKSNNYKQIDYNFEKHLNYKELEKIYNNLNKSEIVKLEIIGKSYDGRNIYSIEIGEGKDTIMLNGNIHAAEIAPTLFLTKYAIDLVNDWESNDKEIRNLLHNHTIVMIPTINPDGYNYSLYGKETIKDTNSFTYENSKEIDETFYKANINGVDLNRNLPTQTSGLYFSDMYLYSATSRVKSTEMYAYFPGDSVGSEPETKALIYWMYKHYKNSHAFIDIHSAGRVIYNGKQYLSDRFNELSEKCAEVINNYTDYHIIGIELFDDGRGTDGNTTDMIGELAHGYKFSTSTGRLSTTKYGDKVNTMEKELCAITLETLENYTQNLKTIKSEYYNKKLGQALTAIARLNF